MPISNKEKLVKKAAYVSLSAVISMFVIRLYLMIETSSMSVTASLVDSLLDFVTAGINLFAIYYSQQPPDKQHRFGHGKAEDIAVFAQGLFFGSSGIYIIYLAMQEFIAQKPIETKSSDIILMIGTIIINLAVVYYQRTVIKKTNSSVIKADNLHYLADLLTNLAVISSLIVNFYFKVDFLDKIFGLIIGGYIIFGSYSLLKKSLNNLMDRELEDQERNKITAIIKQSKDVLGFHDLKTRYAGNRVFIQFHVELDGNIILEKANKISENIIKKLSSEFKDAEIIIHQDPFTRHI